MTKKTYWTPQEIDFLKKNYEIMSIDELGKSLRRSKNSISQKAKRLRTNNFQFKEMRKNFPKNNEKCECGSYKDFRAKMCRDCWKKSKDKYPEKWYVSRKILGEKRKGKPRTNFDPSKMWSWKNGISKKPNYRKNYAQSKWKEFSKKLIKERKECDICGSKEKLVCHHKKPWRKFPQLGYVEENIAVLCVRCHTKVHSKDNFYTRNHAPRSYERIKSEINHTLLS